MDFFTLLILLFIVSRVVEALRSSGTRPPPLPPGQRRGQGTPRAPGQLPPERPQPGGDEGSPASASEEERAAAMIPEDLWELLTGEKRPRPTTSQSPPPTTLPKPKPMPVPEEEFDPWGEGMARDEHALTEELRTSRLDRTMLDEDEEAELLLAQRREALADRDPERTAKVVSLFTERPKPAVRHARFHRRLEELNAPPPPPRSSPAARLGLRTTTDLRHAFVLNEVLGRPRALDDNDRPV